MVTILASGVIINKEFSDNITTITHHINYFYPDNVLIIEIRNKNVVRFYLANDTERYYHYSFDYIHEIVNNEYLLLRFIDLANLKLYLGG